MDYKQFILVAIGIIAFVIFKYVYDLISNPKSSSIEINSQSSLIEDKTAKKQKPKEIRKKW